MTKNIKLLEQRIVNQYFKIFYLNENRLQIIGKQEFFIQHSKYGVGNQVPEVVQNQLLENSKQQLISNSNPKKPQAGDISSSMSKGNTSTKSQPSQKKGGKTAERVEADKQLLEYLKETGYSDFKFEIRYIKREDLRPITHIQNRQPMVQKNLLHDDLSDKSSGGEEYDVFDEENLVRQELYHLKN